MLRVVSSSTFCHCKIIDFTEPDKDDAADKTKAESGDEIKKDSTKRPNESDDQAGEAEGSRKKMKLSVELMGQDLTSKFYRN